MRFSTAKNNSVNFIVVRAFDGELRVTTTKRGPLIADCCADFTILSGTGGLTCFSATSPQSRDLTFEYVWHPTSPTIREKKYIFCARFQNLALKFYPSLPPLLTHDDNHDKLFSYRRIFDFSLTSINLSLVMLDMVSRKIRVVPFV